MFFGAKKKSVYSKNNNTDKKIHSYLFVCNFASRNLYGCTTIFYLTR